MMRPGAALVALLMATPVWAQTPASPQSQAYYEFLMARRLEAEGDQAAALAALERAKKLDPNSAELLAELAGFHARQNRGEAAVAEAERALAIDPKNTEAHHVLALIYSAWADGGSPLPAGQTPASARALAVEHLSALVGSPLMATDPNLQMTLGRLQLRAGRPKDAVPVLERVVAQVPWAGEPLALLAEARLALGQVKEAEEALEAAAEINPRYFVSLADVYERQGRWADAAGAYGEAVQGLRAPSRDLRVRWITALTNVPGGAGAAKAREVVGEMLKADPTDSRLLYLKASAERAAGDLAAAEATARTMIDVDPGNVSGLYALSLTLFDRHEYRRMVEALAPFAKPGAPRARGREAEGAMVLVQLGIAYQQLGEFDAAIDAFTQARALTPRDPDLDAYLVQAHLTARRFERAEALARESLARAPNQPRMERLRAQALARSGRVAEGLKLLEDGVAANPGSREYLVGLADLYADQKRTDDAVRLLEQARKTFGDDETLALRVASAYESGGRLDMAEREFRRLLAEDPLNANAMNSLAYMLAERGLRLPEAIELAQRALKVEPGNPAYLDTLAWALFKSGKAADAAEPMARAAAALAGSSVIQDHHGDVLMATGKADAAVAAWERALAGDGEDIDRAAIEKKIKDARARRR
jgi:tetratricopeptide (TPR) repeat protein